MKRLLSALMTLVLALTLTTPALAAGTPDWNGPLGASAGPVVCRTGKDYVLYYAVIGGVWRSADGVTWTELDRQWAEDAALYSTGVNGLAHKEFQLLWTGTEYMMRQSLRDDPREAYQTIGDSPRNNWVTFLDEEFRILGVKDCGGPVTAIRYAGGIYYATVDGVEQSFTRADWDGGENQGSFYSGQGPEGRYIIRERAGDDSAFGLAVSTDGRSWRPIGRRMTPDMMRLKETGGAVIYYCAYSGELWYWDGTDWAQASMPGIGTSMTVNYDACWTGDGYLVVQTATGGGMMGWNRDAVGEYNNSVLVTDGQFQIVAEHDFGAPVTGLACAEGVCYAQVLTEEAYVIYQSDDRVNWTATAITALPEGTPKAPAGAKALAAGDQTDRVLIYRMNGGPLLVSADGVYFRTLSGWEAPGMKICAGTDGTLLLPTDKQGIVQDPAVPLTVDYAEIRALCDDCFGQAPIYVAVDGKYMESVDLPLYQISGCTMAPMRTLAAALGLDFTYDGATRTAVCTRDGLTISVQVGSTWATVNGETTNWLAVPARLDGGILYVPVRFLAEAAGMDVAWEAEGRTFRLTTPQA